MRYTKKKGLHKTEELEIKKKLYPYTFHVSIGVLAGSSVRNSFQRSFKYFREAGEF
jgi:hypothetical protein